MESAPKNIDVDALRDELLALPSVCAVNDLHIWLITSGMPSASVHVVTEQAADRDAVLADARSLLATRFGIAHSTIQVERGGVECAACDAHW
jgi:cobalt-zinc-cadmium efflux system protein